MEKLDKELESCLCDCSPLGTGIKHPLVYSIPHFDSLNQMVNNCLKQKRAEIALANDRGDWGRIVWLHERPYRLMAFGEVSRKMSDEEYWELLSSIWSDSENIGETIDMWNLYLSSSRSGQSRFMSDMEQDKFDRLPSWITIYRGTWSRKAFDGLSWTLSPRIASWFAHRFGGRGASIQVATVAKSAVLGLLLGRNELEIVLRPGTIGSDQFRRRRGYNRKRSLIQAMELAKSKFQLGRDTDHGWLHWSQVERNAVHLARLTPGADEYVCRLFAIFHDCCRLNESSDPQHGHRAVKFLKTVNLSKFAMFGEHQRELLFYAIAHHNEGETSDDPTIGCCWDADRLDLFRVGITTSANLLSTQAGLSCLGSGVP